MKITFSVFVVVMLLIQVEVLGLLFLNGGNLRLWSAQSQLNDSMISLISNQCINK